MEYFRIKQKRSIITTFYKPFLQHVNAIFLTFFIFISLFLMLFDIRGSIILVKIKHNIQFQFLECTKNFTLITNLINKTTMYWNYGNCTQYKDFLNNSYLENSDFNRILNENKHLKNLLKYLDINNLKTRKYLTTKIIFNNGSTYGFINLGKKDGIKNNQAVFNEDGLIGKIIYVTENQAKVIFITDSNCRISAITAESRYKIITSGRNDNYIDILYLTDNAKLKIGEMVVTTADFNFPVDVKIGTVNAENKIKPLIDLNNIDFITIITD